MSLQRANKSGYTNIHYVQLVRYSFYGILKIDKTYRISCCIILTWLNKSCDYESGGNHCGRHEERAGEGRAASGNLGNC